MTDQSYLRLKKYEDADKIRDALNKNKIIYHNYEIVAAGCTSSDRCRKVEAVTIKIYNELAIDDDNCDHKLIHKFVKSQVSADCDGKYVSFDFPDFVDITNNKEVDDDRNSGYTTTQGKFVIMSVELE